MKQKLIFLTVFLTAIYGFSAEYYVDASRPDDTGSATNWATAKKTIQAAVNLAADGSIIWVTNGTYLLSSEISVTTAITIRSVNGPDVTIVDGNGVTRCFNLSGVCLVDGLTIRNGKATNGGGAYLSAGSILNHCIFSGNIASNWIGGSGGGAFLSKGGLLNNCVLEGNYASQGGGAFLSLGGTLDNCTLSGNFTKYDGGGVYFDPPIIPLGAATLSSSMYANALNNCIVYGNTKIGSSGDNNIYPSGVSWTANYTCASPLPPGIGNISANPFFINKTNGNFQLQSNSPCVNTGNNAYAPTGTDLAGNPRIIGGTVDMGAYEFYAAQDDYDGDGIPNEWEDGHFGGINRADASAICSNGVNTILQAYIAGLDPNDPDSKFKTSVLRSLSGNILGWNATSGRVYAVYYSTNLLNGFQPLETNISWTAGCFTDSVHNASRQLFYKLDVRLED